jgi:hypothetical protein
VEEFEMPENRDRGREIIRQMLPTESVRRMENPSTVGEFGSEFPRLALENVYESLWAVLVLVCGTGAW